MREVNMRFRRSHRIVWAAFLLGSVVACAPARTPDGSPTTAEGASQAQSGAQGSGGSAAGLRRDDSKDVYRFVAVGDTGYANEAQARVLRGIQKRCDQAGGCDGFLLPGDAVYGDPLEGPEAPQLEEKIGDPFSVLKKGPPPAEGEEDDRPRMPVYFALGNHDLGDDAEYDEDRIEYWTEYASERDWFHFPSELWSRRLGFVRLIGVNTTPMDDRGESAQRQADFVDDVLADGRARWNIMLAHDPYRSNALHGNAEKGSKLRRWVERNVCGRIDLYLSGHDHTRQWLGRVPKLSSTAEICDTYFAVSGAGSYPRDLRERGNDPEFASDELGFLFIELRRDRGRVEFCNADGETDWSTHIAPLAARE
ncbi:MAG: metallophosphoesterase [Bradymonadaceae bacterium]